MNRGLFELVGEDVIKAPIMNFTQQFSDALIPTITPVLVLGLTLYYVLKGYLAMTGIALKIRLSEESKKFQL